MIGELDPHTPCSQKTKKENRSHIVTNSKKPLKTVYIKKKILKTGRSKYLPQIFYVGEWQTWVWASLVAQESACNIGDPGSISGLGRSLGEGKGSPLQYSDLENFMDCIVHGAAKSQTQLSDLHFIMPCAHYYAILNSMLIYSLSPENRVSLSRFSCKHHHRIRTTLCT